MSKTTVKPPTNTGPVPPPHKDAVLVGHHNGQPIWVALTTINPVQSLQLLTTTHPALNPRTRKEEIVDRFARIMSADQWDCNHNPLGINPDKQLYDGQTRAAACIKAGKSFKTLIVWGFEQPHYCNAGIPEPSTCKLKVLGFKNVTTLQATAKVVWKVRRTGSIAGMLRWPGDLHQSEIESTVQQFPTLRDSVAKIHGTRHLMEPAMAAALHWVFSQQDAQQADAFFTALVNQSFGPNPDLDPVCHLHKRLARERLAQAKGKRKGGKDTQKEFYALVVKVWNIYVRGGALSQLSLRLSGQNAEAFPEPGYTDQLAIAQIVSP